MPEERLHGATILEEQAAKEATQRLRERLELLTRKTLAAYEILTTDETRKTLLDLVATQINATSLDGVTEAVRRHALDAARMGAEDAARDLAVPVPDRVSLSRDTLSKIYDIETKAREHLTNGAQRLREATDLKDVEDALTHAHRSVSTVERDARSSVNTALSEGTTQVTEEHGVGRMWIAERDACVHCLAYAGEVTGPGEQFRAGLTFGAKALRSDPFDGPPLHPNCRCRVVPYLASRDEGLREAYKREAVRSILRGFSLPSESEKTRLDAAERVLRRGSTLPKSVQDYARRSLKQGHFSRGRTFPDSRAAVEREQRKAVVRREVSRGRDVRSVTSETAKPARSAGLDTLPKRTLTDSTGKERADVLAHINPNYGEPGYGINCVHVAAASELRRRGFDVEATPLPPELWGNGGRNLRDALDRWHEGEDVYVRANGTVVDADAPGARRIRERGDKPYVQVVLQSGGLQTNTLRSVKEWGPNARGWIVLAWKGGGAHIFTVEVDERGKVVLYDGQTGQVVKAADYFGRARQANLIRTDRLVPTEGVIEFVRPASGRVNSGYRGAGGGDPATATR